MGYYCASGVSDRAGSVPRPRGRIKFPGLQSTAELGSKLLIPDSAQFLFSAIAGTREVGEGHSGVGGREVEGGVPGPSLPGSQAFLLAESSC